MRNSKKSQGLFGSLEYNISGGSNARALIASAVLAVFFGYLGKSLISDLGFSKSSKATQTLTPAKIDSEDVLEQDQDSQDSSDSIGALNKPALLHLDRKQVLTDYEKRIDPQFQIPEGIADRVEFWFDIYTRFGYHERVIHHGRFPWIKFQIVDVSEILNAQHPKARWLREQRANNLVETQVRAVRESLWKISRAKDLDGLDESSNQVLKTLRLLPGNERKLAKQALEELRVQTGQRDFFMQAVETSSRYLPRMEELFIEQGLPPELTRIPFVESSFNKVATSKAGAAGVWQFMNNTGRKFMILTDTIDERRSPFKSTEAAARLLKENHMILFRSWPHAITAYNHGPSGVRRGVKRVGSLDISRLSNEHQTGSFDFASQNYYSEFLAALFAEKYSDHVWSGLTKEPQLKLSWFKLPRALKPSEIVLALGLSSEDLLFYNADIKQAVKQNTKLPKGFRLTLPAHLHAEANAQLAAKPKQTTADSKT